MENCHKHVSKLSPQMFAVITLPCVESAGIGECVSDIYQWSLAVVGIVAFAQIIYAGWLYLTAAGNTTKTGQAMSKISNAILGIVLLFSSYLILKTINPDLVGGEFSLPKLTKEGKFSEKTGNTGSKEDLTKIVEFDVVPEIADLSDNTPLNFKLKIFGSKEGIDKLCGAGNGTVFYRVFYVAKDAKFTVRYHAWSRNDFGTGGKAISLDFTENLKTGSNDTILPVKVGEASYIAEFRCPLAEGQYRELNTSSPASIIVVP